MSVNEKMTAIADAVRDKTGGTEELTLDGMAAAVPEVYDAGREAEARAWWDCMTGYNTRTTYDHLFRGADFNLIGGFNPPYTLKPDWLGYTFTAAKGLKRITKEQVDFSNIVSCGAAFWLSDIEYIEEFNTYNSPQASMCFVDCRSLKTVGKFILYKDGVTNWGYQPFGGCSALENIVFEGVIAATTNFHPSPLLTSASIENIMSVLSDTAEEMTITFNSAAKTTYYNAHSSEYADADEAWDALCATKSNWTISLV